MCGMDETAGMADVEGGPVGTDEGTADFTMAVTAGICVGGLSAVCANVEAGDTGASDTTISFG